jgi:hypothetical protein
LDYFVLAGILIFVSLAAAGLIPLLMFFKVKIWSIRILSLLLGSFAVIHGLYHLASGFGNEFLGDVVFEPVSISILVAFGLYYSKKGIA